MTTPGAVVHDELPPTGDVIEVDELRLRCVIGINREERRDRQDVVISLRIGTDDRPAAEHPRLADRLRSANWHPLRDHSAGDTVRFLRDLADPP